MKNNTIVGNLSKCRGQNEVDEAKQYYDELLTNLSSHPIQALEQYVHNNEKYNIGISDGWEVDENNTLIFSIKWVGNNDYVSMIAEDIYFPHPIKIKD